MLGDQAQPARSDESRNTATSGPRHAAPRKSLLTKLYAPAGKAVALAAMPTAVLMGMGFTPHLAQADELPENPFKPGPCVTQSDSPSPSPTGADGRTQATPDTSPAPKSADKATPTPSASPSAPHPGTAAPPTPPASPSASGTVKPAATGSPPAKARPKSGTAAAKPSASPSPPGRPGPSPSPTTGAQPPQTTNPSTNPWDPLGLGNLLGGLLGGGKTPSPSPTTTPPKPAPTTSAPKPAPSTGPAPTTSAKPPAPGGGPSSGTSAAPPAKGPSNGSAGGPSNGSVEDTAKDTAKDTGDAVKKALQGLAGATRTPTASPAPSASGKAVTNDSAPAGGKQAYPCPTYDAKALADAKVEPGIPPLPDAPWTLETSKLTLYGLNYDGIVQVRTHNGSVKDVMKFTTTGVDIENLHQIVDGPGGTKTHVTSRAGSTSTIRNGTTTMYTESLSGNLLGLVPITFTPKAPPPLTLPVLFFTDATVVQAAQFGGDLHVPGMRVLPNQPQ